VACSSRTVKAPETPGQALIVLLPDAETGHVGRATVSNAAGKAELTAARDSVVASSKRELTAVTPVGQGDVDDIFGTALDALPPPQRHFTLFFQFDSEELTGESRALAPEIVRAVKERRVPEVLIVGHTDTTGAKARNFELGLRRANKVRALLRDAGLSSSLIDVISHGETELLVPTRDGIFEARNRRVEITVR
jgi:outer membrane protein OmpA-like peptidoglycan-associated protein